MSDLQTRIKEIDERLEELPKGTLTYKTINGRKQPYLQRTIEGKSKSFYIRQNEREEVLHQIEERTSLQKERDRLCAYADGLKSILERNPYLVRRMSIGFQDFGKIMENQSFYVDKTHFISEWLRCDDNVTLITRPRRFGKTLLMSTLDYYFSPDRSGHEEYFQKLRIWKSERFRSMYGRIPVIFISFGGVKGGSYESALKSIAVEVYSAFSRYRFLRSSEKLNEDQKQILDLFLNLLTDQNYSILMEGMKLLSEILESHYGIKPIILLDEYDTPLTESYVAGYWNEMISFYRGFIHATFKGNAHFQRALITGVTKISKSSLFSDMNNISVHSCTDNRFSDCFGFTEQEVMDALECYDIQEMAKVKENYDGFIFGKQKDIYNPWSICNYMRDREFRSYWINTSSNEIIGQLIRKHSRKLKEEMEDLLCGKTLRKRIDEDVAIQYLDGDEETFWSLLLATGYIKAENIVKELDFIECDVSITNKETAGMFKRQILRMFSNGADQYPQFVDAMLKHQTDYMKEYLEDLTYSSMSYFDTGKHASKRVPENFYHGLVLGLIVSLKDRYQIQSNRESGSGRYDIAIIPKNIEAGEDAFIIEFKIRDAGKEKSLEETAERALQQIKDKHYAKELTDLGILKDRIYMLGFGFEGKDVELVQETG